MGDGRTRCETFHTPEGVRLEVRIPAGSVEIETADVAETLVELEPVRAEDREAVETATIEQRGRDVVVAIVEERRLLFFERTPEVRARVRCPHGADLGLRSVSADVRARGRLGGAELKTVSGDLDLERVEGDASAKTVSGDVSIAEVAGRGSAQTVSGDLTLERVAGRLEFRSVSGDARVGEAGSSVTGQTVSGDVRVEAVSEGEVRLKSVSGDLHVGVQRGSRVWVDARSASGETTSELELGDAPADGEGPLVELRATAMSGDVRVVRAG